MKTRIEPLNHSHISEIMEIENTAHLAPWSERIVSSSFGPRSHNMGLFKIEKKQYQLIGYYFSDHVAGEVSLENICIAKDHQGKGLSKALMSDLFTYSGSIQAEEIWLEVRESNQAAVALYESFGFVTQSVRKNYYSVPNSVEKEHALSMKKAL